MQIKRANNFAGKRNSTRQIQFDNARNMHLEGRGTADNHDRRLTPKEIAREYPKSKVKDLMKRSQENHHAFLTATWRLKYLREEENTE